LGRGQKEGNRTQNYRMMEEEELKTQMRRYLVGLSVQMPLLASFIQNNTRYMADITHKKMKWHFSGQR